MNLSIGTHFSPLRAAAAGLVAACVLLPVTALAAPAAPTGTVVGVVTCGADEATPAAHVPVVIEGMNLRTVTDGAGRYVLANVPVGPTLTIDAVADAQASIVTSRFNVIALQGQTLDVGSIDLAICAQSVAPPAEDNQGQPDFANENAA